MTNSITSALFPDMRVAGHSFFQPRPATLSASITACRRVPTIRPLRRITLSPERERSMQFGYGCRFQNKHHDPIIRHKSGDSDFLHTDHKLHANTS